MCFCGPLMSDFRVPHTKMEFQMHVHVCTYIYLERIPLSYESQNGTVCYIEGQLKANLTWGPFIPNAAVRERIAEPYSLPSALPDCESSRCWRQPELFCNSSLCGFLILISVTVHIVNVFMKHCKKYDSYMCPFIGPSVH